jgi:beta-barrel assembly-enhancing protease
VAVLIWLQAIPRLAAALAGQVPVAWEEHLGQQVSDGVIANTGECKDPRLRDALEEVVRRLSEAKPSPYHFRVRISRSEEVNAFAAPGGYIVVLRGLIEKADSPEEVAGVLGHEMEHVRQRHVTRGLMRSFTMYAVIGMLMGDPGTLGRIVQQMGALRFQREDEASADREGMRTVAAAGIDPAGMIGFFEKLSQQEGSSSSLPTYLSTHPDTKARLEELRRLAKNLKVRPRPLDSAGDWAALRKACD